MGREVRQLEGVMVYSWLGEAPNFATFFRNNSTLG